MRDPGQRVPIGGVVRGEGPLERLPGGSAQEVAILLHIGWVVKVHEALVEDGPVRGEHGDRQRGCDTPGTPESRARIQCVARGLGRSSLAGRSLTGISSRDPHVHVLPRGNAFDIFSHDRGNVLVEARGLSRHLSTRRGLGVVGG